MNQPKPFDREEAFVIYSGLLDASGLELAMDSPSSISEPLASTAIHLAQIFHEKIAQYQKNSPHSVVPFLRTPATNSYGGFESVTNTVYFCSFDGQRLPIADYDSPAIANGKAETLNSNIRRAKGFDGEAS